MTVGFGPGRIAYPGLRAFGREEFDLFFGRESCVDEMVDTLGRTRFLAVLGTSGSGKSSLVRTGLLNALELGFLASAGATWRIAELRPRGHPIRSLAIALLEVQGVAAPGEAEIEILAAFLRRGPRSLIEWAKSGHLPPRANLIVLVDQFEELFRYQDYSGREEAEAFVGLLVTASREAVPIHVAITMRSEYLGACTLIDGLPEVINRGLYLTPRMSREECRQAIVGPAEVCGFGIEDRLVNKLLNDLTDFAPWEAGGGHDQQRRLGRRADQLPLMQHVLNLLWQRARARNETDIVLTLADYEAAGGLGGALDRHADEVAASVPAEHQSAIDPVFRSLVTGRTVEDAVRRPTRFREIVALDAGEREAVAAVVDAFRAQGVNFLTPGTPDPIHDDTVIDISHESLIRQWRRLSRCLDEEAHSADAWNQLLTRAERYRSGAGSLLTGLDLDNLLDWWERTRPIAAWADRYGNNFEEAERFLRDSQIAEADRKRRDEEEERKLLAAEQEANTGRRFKRLAGALAAALIIAFCAVGAAIYLWRESNAEALAALEAQAEADRQRQIAEAARTEAEEQRIIAQAEAAAAEAARAEADQQRAIAEAERAEAERARSEAERARALAEAAEAAAIVAREQADRIIDSSIAYFAKSLGDEVASIQSAPSRIAELGYAGGLLSRLAGNARAKLGSDIDTDFIDALRPAFVVQDALSGAAVPSLEPAATGAVTRWTDPPGAPGLRATIDWVGRTVALTDSTGRVAVVYDVPTSFWGAEARTPFAALEIPGSAPVAVMADAEGQLWLAARGEDAFAPVAGGDLAIGRIEAMARDPASGGVLVGFALGRTGERGQSVFGSGLRVAVLQPDIEGWRVDGVIRMPRGPLPGGEMPLQLAGVAGGAVLSVADGGVVRTDLQSGHSMPLDIPGSVVGAGLTADGRFLLAGGLRDESGACFGGSGRSGFLDPWRGADPAAPQPAGLTVVDSEGGEEHMALDAAPVPDCLLLFDLREGMPLWRGEADGTRLHTVRLAGDGSVEVVEGTAPDVHVLRVSPGDGGWAADTVPFAPAAWGLGGFGETYAAKLATGSALPAALTPDAAEGLMRQGLLGAVAEAPAGGRPIAWRVGDGEVQVARAVAGEGGTEDAIEVLVYRPGQDGFIRDDRIDGGRVACVAPGTAETCRFDAAALSPDGNWLLVTAGGSHAFVGRAGILSGWQPNAEVGRGEGMAAALTFTAIEPADPEGKAFVAATREDGGLRRITRLAPALQGGLDDRFLRQSRSPDVKAGEGASIAEGAGGTGGSGGQPVTAVSTIRLPGHVESDRSGFTTDPARGRLYVWGPRIGLHLVRGDDGDTLASELEFPAPIADAAVLGNGEVVAATADGQLVVDHADSFDAAAESGFAPLLPSVAVATGLGGAGPIDVRATGDRIIVNAGTVLVDGVALAPGVVPAPEAAVDVAGVRSLGYRRNADGGLVPRYVVPWQHLLGELESGEVVAAGGGEVLAAPRRLPGDSRLLALAVMREAAPVGEAPAFEIGFDMLRMRFGGEAGEAAVSPEHCAWALGVAVRMDGDIAETIGDDVKRACDVPAATGPLVAAVFDDRLEERIGALLRLAPDSALARSVLASALRPVAPAAADILAAGGDGRAPVGERDLTVRAELGLMPRDAGTEDAGFDPFAHWAAAMALDRAGATAEGLGDALFHYGYAERLFELAGTTAPPPVVKRRLALARVLGDDIVEDVFERLGSTLSDPAKSEAVPDLGVARLETVEAWLGALPAGEAGAAALRPLVGLVAEMRGDELAETDPAAAAAHYRAALAVVLESDGSLSLQDGLLGRIDKVQAMGTKLAVVGDPAAKPDAAAAVLAMIDATLDAPVRRDVDPPELRAAITGALSELAAAGAEGYDLAPFRGLGLRFLDFDWESRFQSINQVGAERFHRELAAAEAFAGAAVAGASAADRPYWLALRGRLRFWLSTLEFEGLAEDPAAFRDLLAGSIADFDAAGGAAAVSLWDATIIGGGHSRMVELAATHAEALDHVARAAAGFRNAIDRDGTQQAGSGGQPEDFLDLEQYRRRLAFDGYVLALERAMIRLRGDPFLSGVAAQPGDPGYDRAALADIGYAALDLARQRETLRYEAEVNGLLERNSTWSLDTLGDFYWGATVGQLGALLRREAGLNGTADLCERLAAHPYDVMRAAPAVDYDALDVDAVLRACREGTPRSLYHQARALAKEGTVAADEILRLLLPAAREGLPIVYNSISVLVAEANGPIDDSQGLMTTFSQLSLIRSYPKIAALLSEHKKSAARAETFEWLARKAADLGVPEAYVDIAALTPDVLTQSLNFMIARDLFRAAGRTAEADAMQAKLDVFNLSGGNIAALEAQAAARYRVAPVLLDDAMITRFEDLLWDARSQATLR